jgi:hypothetical protein
MVEVLRSPGSVGDVQSHLHVSSYGGISPYTLMARLGLA